MKKTLPLLSLMVVLGACEKQPEYIMNQDVFCGERKQLSCENKDAFCDDYTAIFVCEDADGNPITGHVVKLASDGTTKKSLFVKKGLVYKSILYGSDGKQLLHSLYKNGEEIDTISYTFDTKTRTHAENNTRTRYDADGRLKSESKMIFAKDIESWSVDKTYDEQGKLKQTKYSILRETNTTHMPLAEGAVPSYLVGIEEYKDGKLDGARTRYVPSWDQKQIIYSEEWKDGQLNGVVKRYDFEGALLAEMTYRNGIKNGISRTYSHGVLKEEEPYFYGQLHGTVKRFYPNGQIEEEVDWKYDEIVGSRKYSETGELIER